MFVAVLKEPDFETRVSLLAEGGAWLVNKGIEVGVETGAGEGSYCSDDDYKGAKASIHAREELIRKADIILQIHPEGITENMAGKIIIGAYQPLYRFKEIRLWALWQITVFSLDMLPRTTRAQSMDVLSSQANIAGYKAILEAANRLPHYFPMLMTAAGSIPPARVLILGAGVAGLQAIATARRLGAVVEVFDTRPAVKEEVMSLGAKFIEVEGAADASKAGGYAVEQDAGFLDRQKAKIAASIAKADVVVCTAQIPGKRAPILVSTAMIEAMRKGSVIVDLAAATGGNTELTQNNKMVTHGGVRILGNSFLSSGLAADAGKLYGKNLLNFLQLIINKDRQLDLNFKDELVAGACMSHAGAIVNERVKTLSEI